MIDSGNTITTYFWNDVGDAASNGHGEFWFTQLDPGTYEVFYESDGSHSFHDWNAAKPRNPQMWGVTVSVADKES